MVSLKNRALWTIVLLLAILTGCAGSRAFDAGDRYLQQGEYDLALEQFAEAMAREPARHEYRLKWLDTRNRSALWHYDRGQEFARQGQLLKAVAEYRQSVQLDGSLTAAAQKLKEVQTRIAVEQLVSEARDFIKAARYSQARASLSKALKLDAGHDEARQLMQQIEMADQLVMDGYELELSSREPLSLQFSQMDVRQAFAVLGQLSGIHFILDEAIPPNPVSLLLKDASFAQILDLLLKLNGLGKRVLNSHTILVYPKNPEKEKQYEDRVIQVFYLSNIEAKNAVNMLRTMMQTRKIYVHEELNAIVMRDKPEVIELTRQLLEAADRNDSEVVFDLELVEVSHRDVLKLGPKLSTYSISAGFGQSMVDSDGNLVSQLLSDVLTAGGSTDTLASSFSRLESFYTLPTATFDFAKTLTDSEILANPKIRVKNREKAKVHIGTREPIVTTNISTTTGDITSTNVQYIDVGVKLDVQPIIRLDDTVITTLALEVSSILEKEEIAGGGSALRISTTNAGSSLILKDGERTIIGGLIRDDLQDSRNTLPLIGGIPVLGQIFTGRSKEKNKREILLSITPHIVRTVDLPAPDVATIWSGSENDLTPGLRFPSFADVPGGEDFRGVPAMQEPEMTSEAGPGSDETPVEIALYGPSEVAAGDSFVVQVVASKVRDLVAARLTLRYPGTLAEFAGIHPGPLMGKEEEESRALLAGVPAGTIEAQVSRVEGIPGVSGEGALALVAFKVLAAGRLEVSLEACELVSADGQTLSCSAGSMTAEAR
ncbi:secretin N-terminal domain-containing protein [Syntrophotalea acetylenica]|uniref:secretin N-terminal domain-containing protein n=1 Tax=Syntrophotalea acetylenica TaxID=29542 RepID=UPI002A3715F5|nr:secretin N-terminal domain-containing protein [Syntrophotalea acetylenica]MDY0262282.1 secretin N-terminal domain-containing protein [Syntrophotalea acetylenica]